MRDERGRFVKGYKNPLEIQKKIAEKLCLKVNLTISESLAYIIDVFLGDGWATHFKRNYKIGLTANSKLFVESFSDALKSIGLNPYYQYTKHNSGYYHRVSAYSKKLYLFLKNLRLEDLLKIPRAFIPQLIRGLYESDGTDRGRGRGFLFHSTKRQLLDIIQELLKLFDIDSHYSTNGTTPNKEKIVYKLYIPSRFKNKFLSLIKPVIKLHPKKRS